MSLHDYNREERRTMSDLVKRLAGAVGHDDEHPTASNVPEGSDSDVAAAIRKGIQAFDASIKPRFALAAKSRSRSQVPDTDDVGVNSPRDAIRLAGEASGAVLVLRRGMILLVGAPTTAPQTLVVGDLTFDLQSSERENEYRVVGMSKGVVARLIREGGGAIAARFEWGDIL